MYMLCKRKEEFEGKYMGFIFILSITYSILLFYLAFFSFSDQDQFFSLFFSFGQYHPVWANFAGKSFLWWRLSFTPPLV